jgi:hypothetical protein
MNPEDFHRSIHTARVTGSPRVTVHLVSGEQIDITGLGPGQAVELLRSRGISSADILQTVWVLPKGTIAKADLPH